MLEHFHFIRPLWLLALIPLALLAWHVYRPGIGNNPWRRIVDARLLPLLMAGRAQKANRAALWLVAVGWLIAVLALADPTWERRPQPVYQTSDARVVVLDLSRSMDATDLKPSRLVRARYKVEDVLALGTEGQTGLVVYAGDAFTVSPLTRDANTIRSLLGVLDPGIMPIDGGRADLGLLKAGELLRQAGASSGQVLLIADGVEADKVGASERAAARLRSEGYRVSVLGVGTEDGAPLINARGAPLRDAGGKVLVSRLDATALQAVARAGGGKYRSITDSGAGLRTLLSEDRPLRADVTTQTDATTQGWKEKGPLLALLLLPLAALAFRRNWLFSVALLAGLASPPQPAMASTWDDLWRRPEQQAAKALDAGDYAKAAALATDADRRGSAEYKRGNYQLALDNFAHATGADADYNRGNALARLGRYQDAIAAYDKVAQGESRRRGCPGEQGGGGGTAEAAATTAATAATAATEFAITSTGRQVAAEPKREQGRGPEFVAKQATKPAVAGRQERPGRRFIRAGAAIGRSEAARRGLANRRTVACKRQRKSKSRRNRRQECRSTEGGG